MQIKMPKKIIFFLFVTLSFTQQSKSQYVSLKVADSLFRLEQYDEAVKIFENQITISNTNTSSPVILKLAMMYEKKNNFSKALYYLTVLYNRQPQQATLNKITEIALKHNLSGYQEEDLSFIFFLFRKYSLYFFSFLLIVAVYSYYVLINKKQKQLFIRTRHKWTVVLYLIALLVLLNLPDTYKVAIVSKKQAFVRDSPSSAAPITEKILEGNKLSIIGRQDQWLHIWWNSKLYYIKEIDVWIVN
jgi:tetratricopeptide (TPR) repeat protein